MSKKPDPYASEEDTLAVIRKNIRSEAEKRLEQMLNERGALEQGAEPGIILRQIALDLLAEKPLPNLKPCSCRWNGDVLVQQCTLHQAHIDAIHEWAERAKAAEAKPAAPELLEFAKEWLERQGTDENYMVSKARAAIAKATGAAA